MVLLQWCQLRPQGPTNDIAAVFFTKPVQVASIRIFPTGAQPFIKAPEVVATTEPESFFLDVYFNALPTQSSASNQAKNLLVPSRITYAGGQMDFAVDLGPEYATRLIIFKGSFKEAGMAIYGSVVADRLEVTDYEPQPLPISSTPALPIAVDVAYALHPTSLAEQLLNLTQSPAPLALVMRLMFCLRPEKEDWDNPQFPYVYASLEQVLEDDDIENEVLDLQNLVTAVTKPLKDDISADLFTEFAGKMRDLFGSDPTDNAYYVAQLLKKSACQQASFSKALLEYIDLLDVFNEQSLEKDTAACLAEAVCSARIAKHFLDDTPFIQVLEDLSKNPKKDKTIQPGLRKMLSRIRGWQAFEDALSNPDSDFLASAAFLKDISSEEYALGCWLESMLNNEELVSSLSAHPVPSDHRPSLPLLFGRQPFEITQEEFIVFVRAFLGVATALGILVWADSLGGDDPCCERTLSIMILWQGTNGYREVMNHLLLLRQMTKRLEWLKNDEDDQRPKKPGILVERLLWGLASEPQAMLSAEFVASVLALKPPFCYISSDEVLEMEKLANVAQDGVVSAFEEISYDSVRPFSLRRLRVLRVSIALIVEELSMGDENAQWRVLEMYWKERSQGLVQRLILILADFAEDLNQHFRLSAPPKSHQALVELLMRTGEELMLLITRLVKSYPLPTRDLQALTRALVDLYACSDAARATYSPSTPAYGVTHVIKQSTIATLHDLLKPTISTDLEDQAVRIVFQTLLEHASNSSHRDPVHHIGQILDILDHVLPQPYQEADWSSILTRAVHKIRSFCSLFDPPNHLHFIRRVLALDDGRTGLGEWLLQEHLNELTQLVEVAANSRHDPDHLYVQQYRLSTGIQLCDLLLTSQDTSGWVITAFSNNPDISSSLSIWLSLLFDANIASAALMQLGRELGRHHESFQPDLRFNILLVVLRSAQQDPSVEGALEFVPDLLKSLDASDINVETLRNEIGRTFASYSEHAPSMQPGPSDALLQIIEWLSAQEDPKLTTLTSVSPDGFDYLCTTLSSLLPPDRQQTLNEIRPKLSVDDDRVLSPGTIELPETLVLPLQSIKNLLSSKKEPSTPKAGTKTPDILGVIISPPTAILRSPAATGLTKTYANNDFRQLRSSAATRLNTSRMPSKHVDEFETPAMPTIPAIPVDLLPPLDPTSSLAFPGLGGNLS